MVDTEMKELTARQWESPLGAFIALITGMGLFISLLGAIILPIAEGNFLPFLGIAIFGAPFLAVLMNRMVIRISDEEIIILRLRSRIHIPVGTVRSAVEVKEHPPPSLLFGFLIGFGHGRIDNQRNYWGYRLGHGVRIDTENETHTIYHKDASILHEMIRSKI